MYDQNPFGISEIPNQDDQQQDTECSTSNLQKRNGFVLKIKHFRPQQDKKSEISGDSKVDVDEYPKALKEVKPRKKIRRRTNLTPRQKDILSKSMDKYLSGSLDHTAMNELENQTGLKASKIKVGCL